MFHNRLDFKGSAEYNNISEMNFSKKYLRIGRGRLLWKKTRIKSC